MLLNFWAWVYIFTPPTPTPPALPTVQVVFFIINSPFTLRMPIAENNDDADDDDETRYADSQPDD